MTLFLLAGIDATIHAVTSVARAVACAYAPAQLMSSRLLQFTAVLLLVSQAVLGYARGESVCFVAPAQVQSSHSQSSHSEHSNCDHEHAAPVSVDPQHDACETCIHITAPDDSIATRLSHSGEIDFSAPLVCEFLLIAWTPHCAPSNKAHVIPPDPADSAERCALAVTRLLI